MFEMDFIRKCWAEGRKITLKGKEYRLGRMSYGDYFLEPGKEHKETEDFNEGTLWLRKREDKDIFVIE